MRTEIQESGKPKSVIAAVDPQLLVLEVEQLPNVACLMAKGGFKVFLARAHQVPNILREIGRLREIAFREVGEGTGKALDLDWHDEHYQHLFVWHPASREVIGAYRIGFTNELIADLGIEGLYTHTLFDFGTPLFDRLGPSFELGRSFVRVEWQGNTRALRLLWAGIAVLLDRHPEIKHLFGPVSVSPSFGAFGRMLIMSSLQLHHMDAGLKSLIQARNPPQVAFDSCNERVTEISAGLADPGVLSKFLQRLEQGMALPMLIKHYIELKGRFAGFSVDTSFNNTLDGLVFVRVEDIPARMRSRLTMKERE